MWRPGSTQLFDGSRKNLDENDQVSDQKLLKDTIPKTVQFLNYTETSLQREQLIESSPSVGGATTLLPLIPYERLKERWLGNSMEKLSTCDRIRTQMEVRIVLLFGALAVRAAALTVLGAGILIWNSKVEEASPQAPSHPKELLMPQYCDCSSSIMHRGLRRR